MTSGSLPVASARMRAGPLPMTPVLITVEQVPRSKPQPDYYLLDAKTLGLRHAECIMVEDTITGIQSGFAAVYPVIAVNPPPETPQKEVVGILVDS